MGVILWRWWWWWCHLLVVAWLIAQEVETQTAEQLREINSVCQKLPDISLDLCPDTCYEADCPEHNPCNSLSCSAYPEAVCFFCCCSSEAEWTIDGKEKIACPVVQRFSATITSTSSTGSVTTVITRSNQEPNTAMPVPLASFFDIMLPKLKNTALSSCDALADGDESESPDCQEVLRECRRYPWKDECNSCGGTG